MPDNRETSTEAPALSGKTTPDEDAHARPASGEINHAALVREIVRRFPKILAKLAK
jgi:hypothetical protein